MRAERPSGNRSDQCVRYGIPTLVAIVLSTVWFRPGWFFATGDVAPFFRENLAQEITSLWNHQVSGTGAAGYDITRAADLLLIRGVQLTGLTGQSAASTAQWLHFLLLLVFTSVSVSYLAGVWLRSPWAVAFAGTAAVVNVQVLVSLPLPLPLLAAGLVALLTGIVLRRAAPPGAVPPTASLSTSPAVFALASLPLSYLMLNPPLAALVLGLVVVCALLSGPLTGGSTRRGLRYLVRSVPLGVLVNLWWIVPEAITLFGGGVTHTYEANPDAWQWAMSRSSLLNVAALNPVAAWDSLDGFVYHPYAAAMDSAPWSALRWALPALALAGALFPPGGVDGRARRGLRYLALAVPPLIFLGKGLHGPFGEASRWLYHHVPGMWLLSDPATKVGAVLSVVYAVLAGAAVERAVGARRTFRVATVSAVAVGVVAALVYPYPLWTGAVVSEPRVTLASQQVRVPDTWQAVAARINASPLPGRVLELPLSSSYLVRTSWGYSGANNIPQQLITRPYLLRLPGGYQDVGQGVSELLGVLHWAVSAKDGRTAVQVLRKLGVSQIVLRKDLVSLIDAREPVDVQELFDGLRAAEGVYRLSTGPVAEVFGVEGTGEVTTPAMATGFAAVSPEVNAGNTVRNLSAHVAYGPAGVTVTDDPEVSPDVWQLLFEGPGRHVLPPVPGGYTVKRFPVGPVPFRVDAESDGDNLTFVFRDAVRSPADDTMPGFRDLRMPVKSEPVAVRSNGRTVPWRSGSVVYVNPGDHVEALDGKNSVLGRMTVPRRIEGRSHSGPGNTPAVLSLDSPGQPDSLGSFGPVRDCAAAPGAPEATAFLASAPGTVSTTDGPDGLLVLRSTRYASVACRDAVVEPAAPGATYRISFDYRTGSSAVPQVCLGVAGPERECHSPPQPAGSRKWRNYTATVTAPMRPGELVLSLSVGGLDPRAGDGSVSFRSVRLTPVPVNTFEVTRTAWANAVAADLSRTPDGPSAVSWERTAPGAYRVRLRGVRDHTLVQLAESYTPDWQVSGLPEGWSATHFRADGFANAWKIKGDGDAVVELTYAPGRRLPDAITVSYVFLGLAVWSLVTRRFRRRGAGSLPDLRVLEGFPRRRDTDRDPVTVGTERGLV